MKIDMNKGHYVFKLNEKDLEWNISANNIIDAKDCYIKNITQQINNAIDDCIWRLSELEK